MYLVRSCMFLIATGRGRKFMAESFRFRYDSAMMSVQEYAQEAQVSERSVRARLERGMLQGRKLGSRWVVDALPAAHRSNAGRPISFEAFNALARYCDGQSSVLSAEERRRAKERASAIQVQGPASVERYRARRGLKVHHLQAPPGISSDISQVYGSMVDTYVSSQNLENIIFLYNLLPASADSANVILRECDEPPHILPLHVAVDLLDLGDPRSSAEAEHILQDSVFKKAS